MFALQFDVTVVFVYHCRECSNVAGHTSTIAEQSCRRVYRTFLGSAHGIHGCVAQLAERRSLAGELTLSYARPVADG